MMFSHLKKNIARDEDGAVLVEFGLIFFLLFILMGGITDIAFSIIARQQVNSVAAVGTFNAVKRGADATLDADIRAAVATQVAPVRIFGLGPITVTTTTYCACLANGTPKTDNCIDPTVLPVCLDNFGGSTNYKMTQGVYAVVQASADYTVLFPFVWAVITPLTADNKLPIVVKSYVRVG